jgi:hypothetical protein
MGIWSFIWGENSKTRISDIDFKVDVPMPKITGMITAKEAVAMSNSLNLPEVERLHKEYCKKITFGIKYTSERGICEYSEKTGDDIHYYLPKKAEQMFIDKVLKTFTDLGYNITFKMRWDEQLQCEICGDFFLKW